MIDTILPRFLGRVLDLEATKREKCLRLRFFDFGDYACVKATSFLALHMDELQMKSD